MCFRPASVSKPIRCECGTLNPPDSGKCRKCGAELEVVLEPIPCPRCAHVNEGDAKVCVDCGLTEEQAMKYMGQ